MLAQNFKTPVALGLSDAEFDALAATLRMLEREEIPIHLFDMQSIDQPHECGTAGCIRGWARKIGNNGRLFSESAGELRALFYLSGFRNHELSKAFPITWRQPSTAQAAIALRNYLTHGEPRWAEALAG